MVDLDVVVVKLAEVADRVGRIQANCPTHAETLAEDRNALDLVSFNLILAIQACLDIASHLIADEGWRPATTLAESFVRLHEQGVISARTSDGLQPAAKMRNVLAHLYAKVDPYKVHRAATEGLADLERFAREVGHWAQATSEGR